jgi:hypothetical protein
MKSKDLTVDEIVAALRHTSIPSIIVEGKDDVMIYRWILRDAGISDDRLFPCTGRNNLLKVFSRRNEFPRTPTLFIADKDVYVYNGIPTDYSDVLFTWGYSIENDLYYGRSIDQLLTEEETKSYEKARKNFIRYYGCQLEKLKENRPYNFRLSPFVILDSNYELVTDKIEHTFAEPTQETCNYLLDNYDLVVRGHSVFQLLQLFLSKSGRDATHSTHSLYELCYRMHRTQYMGRIQNEIEKFCGINHD